MLYKIIDEKGRLTIPEAIRNKLSLQSGTIVSLKECGGCLAVHPEKVCDQCKGETPDNKVLEAFDALTPAEKKAVLKRLKGCDEG